MGTDLEHLAARIGDSLGSATKPPWLRRPLPHPLAPGEPVTADDLGQATGRTPDQCATPSPGYPTPSTTSRAASSGRSLTLHPTPHRFTVNGRQLYTWCALDTLIFPPSSAT